MSSSVLHTPPGYISLYELNVAREDGQLIYPFVTKDGAGDVFKTVTTTDFNSLFNYGDTVSGSYPLSASMHRTFYQTTTRPQVNALKNITNYYRYMSEHYQFSSSLGDKSSQEITLVDVPSIFFGSSIKKGTVDLRFYVTGALAGKLRDSKVNGELIQHSGAISTNDGSVAGIVLYKEGIILLTGSWAFSTHKEDYRQDATPVSASWKYWGSTGSADDRLVSSSFELSLSGTNYIPTITMFAHAPKGRLNNSSNPTFIDNDYAANLLAFSSGSNIYEERKDLKIKNTTKLPYSASSGSFEKQTFISQIGIYDEFKNLIAVAKLAQPIRKTHQRDYTFKLKVDL